MTSSRVARAARLVLVTVSAVLLSGFARAQDLVETARSKAQELTVAHQHAEAKAVWEAARAEAEATGDQHEVALCEDEVGRSIPGGQRFLED